MILHGFVQAGGGSTRFGNDKALVQLGGKTMLQRTGELLAHVCNDVTVVAPAGRYDDAPWPVLTDRWPSQGPLGGIVTALEFIRDSPLTPSGALIVGCDMPFLTREFLTYLCELASHSTSLVIAPQSGSGLEPLCACWNARAVSGVRAAFDSGIRKVAEAMKRLPMEVLDEPAWKRFDTDGRLFWNMNTPTDFEEARRILEAADR
jgi:molybdopterin-guanine dinucleotide biosynthesis protein A